MMRLARLLTAMIVLASAVGETRLAGAGPIVGEPSASDETDPIRCWWRTDAGSVRIGEQFLLTLSCGVKETTGLVVVPVENQFEPTALPVAPFEIVGRERHQDLAAPPWRYFQYDYTLRLVSDEYFGKDVDIPSIKITYSIQSARNGASGSEGRDHTYELPALPMRILSLVPSRTAGIREGPGASVENVEARRFRSMAAFVAAALCFVFALVLAGSAVAKGTGRPWLRGSTGDRVLPGGVLLRGCLHNLEELKDDVAENGWTPERAARALSAVRVAGAVALGRPPAQTPAARGSQAREGQLLVRAGLVRQRWALVSAPTTAAMMRDQPGGGNGSGPHPRSEAALEELRDSLRAFDAARYARNGHIDSTRLDGALQTSAETIARLCAANVWWRGLLRMPRASAD